MIRNNDKRAGYRETCKSGSGRGLGKPTAVMLKGNPFLLYIFGLRINQELYNQQQKMYNTRMEYLQKSYTDKVINLIAFAENRGLFIDLDADAKLLEAENAPDNKPLDYNDFRFSGEQIGGSVNE